MNHLREDIRLGLFVVAAAAALGSSTPGLAEPSHASFGTTLPPRGAVGRSVVGAAQAVSNGMVEYLRRLGVNDVYARRVHHLLQKAREEDKPAELQETVRKLWRFIPQDQLSKVDETLRDRRSDPDPDRRELKMWMSAYRNTQDALIPPPGNSPNTGASASAPRLELRRSFDQRALVAPGMPQGNAKQTCYSYCRTQPIDDHQPNCFRSCDNM